MKILLDFYVFSGNMVTDMEKLVKIYSDGQEEQRAQQNERLGL